MANLFLAMAILLEVTAAFLTRYTEGFTLMLPSILVVIFAVAAYFMFSISLKYGMNIAIGYTIWSGAGVLTVALLSAAFINEHMTAYQMLGVVFVIIGLIAVQLGGARIGSRKSNDGQSLTE